MSNTNQRKEEGSFSGGADSLTADQLRQVGSKLWAELRAEVARPVPGRNAWWDAPLNPKRKPSTTVAVKCGRCDGKGAIASFSVRYSGKCFACGGSGVRYVPRAKYEKQKAARKAMQAHCAMTPQRWSDVERGTPLTEQEKAEGWHFCNEWDGMCVHPESPEAEACGCPLRAALSSQSEAR